MSDTLRPPELQHTRPSCPSPTPRVHSDSRVPFSSCPQSLQHQSFPMSQPFTWGGQSTGLSALASFLSKKSQGWSPSERWCCESHLIVYIEYTSMAYWTGWISLQSKGLSRVFSNTTVEKHQFSGAHFLHSSTLTSIHDHWKNHSLD